MLIATRQAALTVVDIKIQEGHALDACSQKRRYDTSALRTSHEASMLREHAICSRTDNALLPFAADLARLS